MDPIFLRHRDHSERTTIDFTTSEHLPYNTRFTMAELTAVISSLRDVAEGPDCLHNNMIKHLPEALQVLLSILNRLWERGEFPPKSKSKSSVIEVSIKWLFNPLVMYMH